MTDSEEVPVRKNLIGLAGDWHGNDRWAVSVLESFYAVGIRTVFQLGDFGFWPGYSGAAYLSKIMGACEALGMKLWIVPGNHEDYTQIEDPETLDGSVPELQVLGKGEGWEVAVLPRGFVWWEGERKFLAFGGAPSIDYPNRRLGISWWQEEMIRDSDLLRLIEDDGVDVMLAHDAPDGGTAAVQAIINTPAHLSMWSDAGLAYCKEGRMKMNEAVRIVNPRLFAHGHMHVWDERYDEATDRRYVALGPDGVIPNVCVLNLDDMSVTWGNPTAVEKQGGYA